MIPPPGAQLSLSSDQEKARMQKLQVYCFGEDLSPKSSVSWGGLSTRKKMKDNAKYSETFFLDKTFSKKNRQEKDLLPLKIL